MKRSPRYSVGVGTLAILLVVIAGCQEGIISPDNLTPSLANCLRNPEHHQCQEGGPGQMLDVTYGGAVVPGAIVAVGTAEVQRDNGSIFEFSGGELTSLTRFNFSASINGDCVFRGGDDDPGQLTQAQLEDRLTNGTPAGTGTFVYDKTGGGEHRLRFGWPDPSGNGRIVFWIADPSFSKQSPVPTGATPTTPVVQKSDNADGSTTYRFVAGNGIVLIKQLFGKPRTHSTFVCHLLQDVWLTTDDAT